MIASPHATNRSGEAPARAAATGSDAAGSNRAPQLQPGGDRSGEGSLSAAAVSQFAAPGGDGPQARCPAASTPGGASALEITAPAGASGVGRNEPVRHATTRPPVWPGPLRLAGQGVERQLPCRVLQSPLAGVSDRIFRNLVRRWAPEALLFTEMVNATSLELGHGRGKVEELALETGPIGVQLFDHRPEAMAEAARRAEANGAFLIDINMGCPVRKIARKGGGSGLIRDPDLAMRIVAAVAAAVRIPVTVKTRLGWCSAGPGSGEPLSDQGDGACMEQNANAAQAVAWCQRLEQAGARLLTLHGRTREQGFSGRADWSAIARVKRALTIPVIANGDVRSPEDALRCLELTGADGVMVGRGTMGAPWLVGRIDAALRGQPVPPVPGPAERLALAAEQLEALVEARGDRGLLIARKHLGWTCQGFAGAAELRHGLMRAGTLEATLELLTRAADGLGHRP